MQQSIASCCELSIMFGLLRNLERSVPVVEWRRVDENVIGHNYNQAG